MCLDTRELETSGLPTWGIQVGSLAEYAEFWFGLRILAGGFRSKVLRSQITC